MIDKNEMRIGNYFIGEDKVLWLSQIRHAANVKEWAYTGWHEETKERIEVNFFDAEPIPLTIEILKKFGFEEKAIITMFPYWEIRSTRINELVEYVFKISTMGDDEWRWIEGNVNVPIYYLHQLQNLYFALTGKEIEIKLWN